MMIVLVDDDEDGVEYSHAVITNHQLGLLSLSLSLDELQSHPNDKVEHVVVVVAQYQSLLWGT